MKVYFQPISLFLFLLIFSLTIFSAGNIDPTFNTFVTDGLGLVSRSLTQPDGKIIAFGSFQKANGARFTNIVRFNADGSLDPTFILSGSGANNYISSAVLQPDNKIVIAGNFTAYNGVALNRIARLNADGSLDPSFNPTANFNNLIKDIVIQPDGKILAGGSFNATSGQTLSSRIVRLNTDGSTDATFQNSAGTNGNINSIAYLQDGKILIGGEFTNIGGTSKPYIARLNSDGTLDNSFLTSEVGFINKILIQPNGKFLLAGDFSVTGVRRLNADGSPEVFAAKPEAATFIVEAGYDIALLPDGKILVAFGFGGSGNVTDYTVIKLNTDLSFETNFQSPVADRFPITDINLLANGKFIIGGSFVALNNQKRLYLAQMNPNGSIDSAFDPAITATGRVQAIKRQPDGKILIGGIFEYVNGVRRTNIARLNPDGSLDNTFNVPPELFDYIANFVFDIELQTDGKILVGRYRLSALSPQLAENAGGLSDGAVMRLNIDGSLDESFGTIITHLIRALNVGSDNKIFIGGYFENITVPPYGSEAFRKLMPNGDLDTFFNPLQPQAGSVFEILIQPDGKILISGVFSNIGSNAQPGTARYNANGTLDTTYFSPVPNIYAIGLASDGKIYAGGSFQITATNPNRNFTRFESNGTVDLTFNTGSGANGLVRDLIVYPDGKIVIGGDFTSYNSAFAKHLARVNPNGSLDTSFNPGAGAAGNVYALESQPDSKILVGGQFLDFDGTEKFSLVRLNNSNYSAPYDYDGDGKSDVSVFRPATGSWYVAGSQAGFSATQFGNSSDKIAPADFDGDGRTDISVFRDGNWYLLRSQLGFTSIQFGTTGDLARPADFDGDGKADLAVFRPSNGSWYRLNSSNGQFAAIQFGTNGDIPVPADFDGDGKADINVFRASAGVWYRLNSSNGQFIATQFGTVEDSPAVGDFDGDAKADITVFRPSNGTWYRLNSSNGSFAATQFGAGGDVPAVGDFDGDGKTDISVFRPSNGSWYRLNSSSNEFFATQFGQNGDTPTPAFQQ